MRKKRLVPTSSFPARMPRRLSRRGSRTKRIRSKSRKRGKRSSATRSSRRASRSRRVYRAQPPTTQSSRTSNPGLEKVHILLTDKPSIFVKYSDYEAVPIDRIQSLQWLKYLASTEEELILKDRQFIELSQLLRSQLEYDFQNNVRVSNDNELLSHQIYSSSTGRSLTGEYIIYSVDVPHAERVSAEGRQLFLDPGPS